MAIATVEGKSVSLTPAQKATRFLLLPVAIFSLLFLISLWILTRQRGGLKWLIGGKGRYAGFDNVYELQQGGPQGVYVQNPPPPHPSQQWTPQPYYVVPPSQQWGPPPTPHMVMSSSPMPPHAGYENGYGQGNAHGYGNGQKGDVATGERAVFR